MAETNIQSHPLFMQLTDAIEAFAKEPPEKSDKMRMHMFTCLRTLLNEVTFTKDTHSQEELLSRVYHWFRNKSRGKTQLPELTKRPLLKAKPNTSLQLAATQRVTFAQEVDLNASDYHQRRRRDLDLLKEAQTRHALVFNWGRSVSRGREETARKQEQERDLHRKDSYYTHNAHLLVPAEKKQAGRSRTAAVYHFETTVKPPPIRNHSSAENSRVQQLRLLHSNFIDVAKPVSSVEIVKEEVEVETSVVTQSHISQIKEVLGVKSRLALKDIKCPIQTLEAALVLPYEPSDVVITPSTFPPLGTGLLSNPMKAKAASKKKKKGKKKKK